MKLRPTLLALGLSLMMVQAAHAQMFIRHIGGDQNITNPLPANFTNPVPVGVTNAPIATYMYTVAYFTPYATPTDIIGIVGSGTKTVKIRKILLDSTQTTAGINQWFLAKRSTADTGGSPAALTAVPLDATQAAATAVVQKYTAAPTTGNLVGNIASKSLLSPAPASVFTGEQVLFDDSFTGKPIVLNGVAQELDINFAGAAVPAGFSGSVTVITTEE